MKNYARLAAWALACLIFGSVSTHAQNITTVIGGGPVGLTATGGSIGSPVAFHQDSSGNWYILDNTYSRVIKVTTAGVMSVYAGNGTTGFSGDGGPAVNAQMNQPSGMCIDSHDNVFVADSDNAVIRVIIGPGAVAPPSITGPVVTGNIYTAVGIPSATNQIYGGDNGPALSANLHFPDGCAFDNHGNLYIADRGNNEVRVVIGAGNTTTNLPAGLTGPLTPGNIYVFAGGLTGATPNPPNGGYAANGTAARGGLVYGPFDVAVNTATNDVYIADLGNNFDANGNPNTQTGQPMNNNVVRMVSGSTGLITTVAGVPQTYSGPSLTGPNPPVATGVATAVALNEPKGLAVTTTGDFYFCDTINQVIRKVSGGNISVVAGSLLAHGYSGDTHAATSATLTFPAGTFVDGSGNIFISDDGSNAVREVPSASGNGLTANFIYTIAGNGHVSYGGDTAAPTGGELNTPAGLAVSSGGNIYVADSLNDLVRQVSGTPAKLGTIAGEPEANGFLNLPIFLNGALGVATDAAGNVYIADTANCIVRKRTPSTVATIAGVEPAIPIADSSANPPVCGFGTAGSVAAGTGGTGGTKLGSVYSVAVDSHGNVFFSDKTNSVIWEVPAVTTGTLVAGNAYIVAGTIAGAGFSGEAGPATAAQISGPTGIYIDIYDNLYIADAGNHRIREVPAINVATPAMTAGSIYTIAGNGTSGDNGDGAAATSAEIATPFAIVVDNAENVFFSDTTNQTVRKVTAATGHITTVAGTKGTAGFSGDGGAALSATLNVPQGLALLPDAAANTTSDLLISDSNNNRVRSVAALASNAAVPLVSFNPNPVVFTAEPQGTASAPIPITITNTGGASLTITGFSYTGTDAGDFTTGTNGCTAPVAANGTCTVNVIFTPSALGTRTAAIVVASNSFGSPQASLTGTGGTPMATLNPTTLTFASTTVNTAASTQPVTLTNGGNVATIIAAGGITITGANAGDFSETDNCVSVAGIAPAATCTITVGFKPTATGARTATLNVMSNVGTPSTVALSGTGGAATLSLTVKDTDSSSSQTVTAGATATYNLSVSGNQSVTATITCTGAPTDATCSAAPASVAVTAAAAGTFKVSVTTTARTQMVPFHQPSTKMQPPSFLQIAPMASMALLFVIAMMIGWMQNPAGRARTLRVAMSLCLILMPIVAATVLVGCGGGSSSTPPPPPAQTGTPAGSYTLTVTATSGSTSAKTTLTLVVN
jgi:hypothetical protein